MADQKSLEILLDGKPTRFSAPFWLLHSLDEIFVDEVYCFQSSNEAVEIIDCGANIGLSSIYLKKIFPKANITAIEPDKRVFEQLQYNINVRNLSNVNLVNAAAWIDNQPLSFVSDGGLGGKLSGENSENTTTVKAIRLKDLLLEKKNIFFLKMDIEGAEYEVLKDIQSELQSVENLFIEFHAGFNEKNNLAEILSWIDNAGFKYYIKEAWNNMPNPLTKKYKGGYHLQLNIFCFR